MKIFIIKRRLVGAWYSLTVWFNMVAITLLPVFEIFKDELPSLQMYMTPDNYKLAGLILAISNIILRFRTTKDLANK